MRMMLLGWLGGGSNVRLARRPNPIVPSTPCAVPVRAVVLVHDIPFRNAARPASSPALDMRTLTPRHRWMLLALVALVAIGGPAAIAFEAWQATQAHRRAAERALRDHAGSAAFAYRERVISRVYVMVD